MSKQATSNLFNLNPKIFQDPQWYLSTPVEFKKYFYDYTRLSEEEKVKLRNERTEYTIQFGQLLDQGDVALGSSGDDFDDQRLPIDTVVIHHSSFDIDEIPDSISYINAMHLIRLYIPEYTNKSKRYYGNPLWSNHFYNQHQTFIGYHFLIWPNGDCKQTLKDEYIGWHCGSWEFNRKSIGLCFLQDLENKEPTPEALNAAKKVIERYNPKNILGHGEIVNRECPGNLFLGDHGWKVKLIS